MPPFRPLLHYADFRGRASRAEYWSFMLLQGLVLIGCAAMAAVSLSSGPRGFLGLVGWLVVAVVVMLVCALPNYAVLARRLHDSGKSARWMALLIPGCINQYISLQAAGKQILASLRPDAVAAQDVMTSALAAEGGVMLVLGLIALGCGGLLFVFTCLPGERGPNRFGPDPKDPDAVAPSSVGGWADADKMDEVFAQARGQARGDARPAEAYKPIFDFGPETEPQRSAPSHRPAVDWNVAPSWNGATPAPVFGRRNRV